MLAPHRADACWALPLVLLLSDCWLLSTSDLLVSWTACRDKDSKMDAGQSPESRPGLRSSTCPSVAGLEPLCRFMMSSPREHFLGMRTSTTLTTTGWSCG